MHKIRHSHTVQLASWRKWAPRCSHAREQIAKITLAQNGVCGCVPSPLFCLLLSQPIAMDNFQHPVPGLGYEETREILPQSAVACRLGPVIWSHSQSFHPGQGSSIPYPSLKGKHFPIQASF